MTPTDSKKVVLLALSATAVIAVVKAAQAQQRPRVGIFIGSTVAGVILTGLADAAPTLAAQLAGLTVIGTALASPDTIATATGALSVRRTTNRGSLKASGTTSGTSSTSSTSAGPNRPDSPPILVTIGKGQRLTPDAARAFRYAEQLLGRSIPITDSYRPFSVQAAGYARDHDRYAPPERSKHVSGEAIDVDTGLINVADTQLINALTAAGWCHPNPDEPWHWSYNGCG